MTRVPDPMWKRDPDWEASESFKDRFLPDDELEEDEFEEETDCHTSDGGHWFAMTDNAWAYSIYARNNRGFR